MCVRDVRARYIPLCRRCSVDRTIWRSVGCTSISDVAWANSGRLGHYTQVTVLTGQESGALPVVAGLYVCSPYSIPVLPAGGFR